MRFPECSRKHELYCTWSVIFLRRNITCGIADQGLLSKHPECSRKHEFRFLRGDGDLPQRRLGSGNSDDGPSESPSRVACL